MACDIDNAWQTSSERHFRIPWLLRATRRSRRCRRPRTRSLSLCADDSWNLTSNSPPRGRRVPRKAPGTLHTARAAWHRDCSRRESLLFSTLTHFPSRCSCSQREIRIYMIGHARPVLTKALPWPAAPPPRDSAVRWRLPTPAKVATLLTLR